MKRRSRGFTLMELMVTVALAGVILGVGVPAFRDFQRNNRITVGANNMLGLVMTARGEALRRQVTVSMCPSANPTAADPTCGAGTGWIVFADPNATCTRTSAQELLDKNVLDTDVKGAWNGNCISFASTGFKRAVGGQPPSHYLMICDERKNTPRSGSSTISAARGVEVLPTGRGAVVRTVAELAAWDTGTYKVSCP